jgi:hypothetical protein
MHAATETVRTAVTAVWDGAAASIATSDDQNTAACLPTASAAVHRRSLSSERRTVARHAGSSALSYTGQQTCSVRTQFQFIYVPKKIRL